MGFRAESRLYDFVLRCGRQAAIRSTARCSDVQTFSILYLRDSVLERAEVVTVADVLAVVRAAAGHLLM